MVGLFYIYLPMSWQIPTQVEQDIIAGKAKYQTFQTGNGGQSILQVPANSYAVIFGYDFSPAGGGAKILTNLGSVASFGPFQQANSPLIRAFETQQISFYTGNDFFPFIHHVDVKTVIAPLTTDTTNPVENVVKSFQCSEEIDNTPLSRQLYITSTNDVTITHGLIINSLANTVNAIPQTNRTPQSLTYGGSAIVMQTQTDYGPGVTPLNFMQPSTKDYADFAFGLLPNNPDNQAFATPNGTNGLDSAYARILAWGIGLESSAAANYYLCLHYALYSAAIPEQRG
jgi:hypothetical protein